MSVNEQEQEQEQGVPQISEQGMPQINEQLNAEIDDTDEQVEATTDNGNNRGRKAAMILVGAGLVTVLGVFGMFHFIEGFSVNSENEAEFAVAEPPSTVGALPEAISEPIPTLDVAKTNNAPLDESDSEQYENSSAVDFKVSEPSINFTVSEPESISENEIATTPLNLVKSESPNDVVSSAISKSELAQIVTLLQAQNDLLTSINSQQKTILDQVNKNHVLASDQIEKSNILADGMKGLFKGNESIIRLVTEVGKSATKVSSTHRKVSSSTENRSDRPKFVAKAASVWGDEVKVMVEKKGGFYQNVQVGDEVEGWTLLYVDLKRKETKWGKGDVKQVLKYS